MAEAAVSPLLLALVRGLSLFNTLCLLWLGLTLLLNVERRRPGAWLAAGAVLLGAGFFALHTGFAAGDPQGFPSVVAALWPLPWVTLVTGPWFWLVLMLWHSERLARPAGRAVLAAATAVFAPMAALLAAAPPGSSGGVPVALVAGDWWPAPVAVGFGLAGLGAALVAVARPGLSPDPVAALGRSRARPWLAAASLALALAVVGIGGLWALFRSWPAAVMGTLASPGVLDALLAFDALLSGCIAVAVVATGQATAAYEVFTGHLLPRRGLLRQWRRCLALSAGFAAFSAAALAAPLPLGWALLAAGAALLGYVALAGWRSFVEHDQSIEQLRPFMAPLPDGGLDAPAAVAALCGGLLGAGYGSLVPLGWARSLVPGPLTFPPSAGPPSPELTALDLQALPGPALLGGDPGSPRWVVPLHNARGLGGALVLGPKQGGGIYSLEEIELAQRAGRRLLDDLATAELSGRLARLERQRLAERQVADQRTRRVLHDDVLPMLQAALMELHAGDAPAGVAETLSDLHRRVAGLLREMPVPLSPLAGQAGVVAALQQELGGSLGRRFAGVAWSVQPGAADRRLPQLAADVLFAAAREALRNAAEHGDGGRTGTSVRVSLAARWRDGLELTIADDGPGIPASAGGDPSHGLGLYTTLLAVLGGSLTIETGAPGGRVVLFAPAGGPP